MDGNGQSELIEALTGLRKADIWYIQLNGKEIQNMKPRKITESGVGHIPEDRHKHGLVLDYQHWGKYRPTNILSTAIFQRWNLKFEEKYSKKLVL